MATLSISDAAHPATGDPGWPPRAHPGSSLHAGGVSTGRVCPGDSAAGARPAAAGSATELRTATSVARPLPQPVFRPGGGHHTSGWAGAVKAGARVLCAPAVGLGLDSMSPPSRYTLSPPGRAGFPVPARAQRSGAGAFPPSPLGGGWWGQRRSVHVSAFAPTTGGRK